jgi:hypothetical protein
LLNGNSGSFDRNFPYFTKVSGFSWRVKAL